MPGCGSACARQRRGRCATPRAWCSTCSASASAIAPRASASPPTRPFPAPMLSRRRPTFPRFLAGMPDGGLIMCHPGYVDPALKSLDSLTDLRERELAYFASEAFPHDLARHRVALMEPAG